MERDTAVLQELAKRYPDLIPCQKTILDITDRFIRCFESGSKLLVCGNGGSAADSDHIAGELMKGFKKPRKLTEAQKKVFHRLYPGEQIGEKLQGALPTVALHTHTALLTAYANDVDADMIFAQQVWGYGKQGDILLAMSTSGNSQNILNAVKTANVKGITSVGITGSAGGALKEICNICLQLPAEETYLVQEYTLPVYHGICAMVEDYFWKG